MGNTSNLEHIQVSGLSDTNGGPTISELATAISGLSEGRNMPQELDDYIKNKLYGLIYSIKYIVPDNVRVQLISGPSESESVYEFIEKIKNSMSYKPDQNDVVSKVFDEYINLFERSGKGCSRQWQKVIGSTYIQNLFTALK